MQKKSKEDPPESEEEKQLTKVDMQALKSIDALVKDNPERLVQYLEQHPEIIKAIKNITVSNSYSYSGPFPHPGIMKGYDNIIPGAAKNILDNYLKDAEHNREIEKKEMVHAHEMDKDELRGQIYGQERQIATQHRGQWFGFVIAAITTALGFTAIMYGHEISGTIFGGVGLTSLVGVFVYGKLQKKKEEEEENSNE